MELRARHLQNPNIDAAHDTVELPFPRIHGLSGAQKGHRHMHFIGISLPSFLLMCFLGAELRVEDSGLTYGVGLRV